MNVEIINVGASIYDKTERNNLVASLTPAYLAALFPPDVNVTIRNQQVRPVDYEIDVDLVAITFITFTAPHAYEIADRFRKQGTPVVMGGFHATFLPDEALEHADAVVIGEAEYVFPEIIEDLKQGTLKRIYKSTKLHSLKGLPLPRYDLIEKNFVLNHPVQATRGCPFKCSFCSVIAFYSGLRLRPVNEVIRDITCFEGRNYLQNKMIMFMDNNLISNKKYAKDLFRKMKPLKKWWWSQVSIDMAKDKELMRLAAESGGLSVVIGIESFSKESLKRLGKRQNKVSEYKNAIKTFHEYGFYVIGMFIIGLDEDTTESIRMIPDMIQEVGLDMPFPNILTPFYGTKIYEQFDMENRIATKDWSLYTGFNTVFQPKNMSVNELNSSYIEMWKEIYSVKKTFKRVFKNIPIPIPGYPSFLWKTLENGFFMSQNLMGKYPIMRMNDKDTFTAEETKQPSKLTAGTVNTP